MLASQQWIRSCVLALAVVTIWVAAVALPARAAAPGDAAPGAAGSSQPIHFVELLSLQPKATPEAAADYFENRLRAILTKHGGEILQSYQVVATMQGDLKPAWINVIRFRSMEDMQAIFKDPDYAKLVPLRDSIFDLSNHPFFSVVPVRR